MFNLKICSEVMLNNKTIAVVVPAFNEEKQIGFVIETMPDFVDRIVVVNDNSTDNTEEIVKEYFTTRHNSSEILLKKKEIIRTYHNESEIFLEEMNRKEINFFTPSKIVNENFETDRIILITNFKNAGVGGSIARGYKWCKDNEIDCTAVMAGDCQMDPE